MSDEQKPMKTVEVEAKRRVDVTVGAALISFFVYEEGKSWVSVP